MSFGIYRQHLINTSDALPILQPPRRHPWKKGQDTDATIKMMDSQGFIELSTSPWASPIVVVKKKDGTRRFCVHYRKLNDITRKHSYLLQCIDNTLDALSGVKWFSTRVGIGKYRSMSRIMKKLLSLLELDFEYLKLCSSGVPATFNI